MTWKSIFFRFLLKLGVFAIIFGLSIKGLMLINNKLILTYSIFYVPLWIIISLFSFFWIIVGFISNLYLKITNKKLTFYAKITFITIIISICLYFVASSINKALSAVDRAQTRVNEIQKQINEEEKIMYGKKGQVSQKDAEYIVKVGDNLWSIAEKYYQTGFDWVLLESYNNLSNPRLIYPNQKLYIPK